jgi:hypothetical protein
MPVKSKSDPSVPTTCPRCQNLLRSNERYCYNCGLELREDAGAIEAYLSNILPTRVDTILKVRLSEQKLVEVETAELLAERAMKWMKTIGYFVGIPLLAASVVLSFFGYKTYSDFEKASEKAALFTKRIDEEAAKFGPAQQRIAALDKSVQEATQKVKEQLAQIDAGQKQLQSQVKSLEDRLAFTPSKELSPELQASMQRQLSDYIQYLESVGFTGLEGKINICIYSKEDAETCKLTPEQASFPNAFLMGDTMFVYAGFAAIPSVVLHEYTHHALRQANTARTAFIEQEEGLADYFAASHLGDPVIGEGAAKIIGLSGPTVQSYIRSLDNSLSYGELGDDDYDKGKIWGGALWRCRSELGPDAMDKIALDAWKRLKASNVRRREEFGRVLIESEARSARAVCHIDCCTASTRQKCDHLQLMAPFSSHVFGQKQNRPTCGCLPHSASLVRARQSR